VQHVGLDPERVTCFPSPDPYAGRRGDRFAGACLSDYLTLRMRVRSVGAIDLTQHVPLLPGLVPLIEGNAVGDILDDVTIKVHLELVHSLGMIARRGGFRDRVAYVYHEDSAGLAAEDIQICDVQAHVLTSKR
jgi:hypothetical protein